MCMSVDLPEPLLPTIATDSPSVTVRETPFSASKRPLPAPYDLCISTASSMESAMETP